MTNWNTYYEACGNEQMREFMDEQDGEYFPSTRGFLKWMGIEIEEIGPKDCRECSGGVCRNYGG